MDGVSKEHIDEKFNLVAKKVLEVKRYIKEQHNLTMALYLYDECKNVYPGHPSLEDIEIEIKSKTKMLSYLRRVFDRALEAKNHEIMKNILEEMGSIDKVGHVTLTSETKWKNCE